MRLLTLSQCSPEWHEYRRHKIGASDAPVIMGVSPYKTVNELLIEKSTGITKTFEHKGIKLGKELEPLALSLINKRYDLNFQPAVMLSDEYDFMMASYDGFDLYKNVACEIKCCNQKEHDDCKLGKVPDKYMPQLQHQMLVANLECIYFCTYRDFEVNITLVNADVDYQAKLIEAEKEFYRCLQFKQLSPYFEDVYETNPYIDDLYSLLEGVRSERLKVTKMLQEKEDEIVAKIRQAVGEREYKSKVCTVQKCIRKTTDYASIIKDFNIDSTTYSSETVYYKITKTKKN